MSFPMRSLLAFHLVALGSAQAPPDSVRITEVGNLRERIVKLLVAGDDIVALTVTSTLATRAWTLGIAPEPRRLDFTPGWFHGAAAVGPFVIYGTDSRQLRVLDPGRDAVVHEFSTRGEPVAPHIRGVFGLDDSHAGVVLDGFEGFSVGVFRVESDGELVLERDVPVPQRVGVVARLDDVLAIGYQADCPSGIYPYRRAEALTLVSMRTGFVRTIPAEEAFAVARLPNGTIVSAAIQPTTYEPATGEWADSSYLSLTYSDVNRRELRRLFLPVNRERWAPEAGQLAVVGNRVVHANARRGLTIRDDTGDVVGDLDLGRDVTALRAAGQLVHVGSIDGRVASLPASAITGLAAHTERDDPHSPPLRPTAATRRHLERGEPMPPDPVHDILPPAAGSLGVERRE